MRVRRSSRFLMVVAAAVWLALLVAGCSGGGAEDPGPNGSLEREVDANEVTATVGPDTGTGISAARVHLQSSGEGYTAEYDAWNCDGIAGQWRIEGEIEVEGYGTISGGGSFNMPPRPDDGPWESEPFSYTMSGTLTMDDVTTDISYEYEDVVFVVIDMDEGPTLGDSRGSVKGTVRVTGPDFSMVVSETYSAFVVAPALIRNERHPSCGD